MHRVTLTWIGSKNEYDSSLLLRDSKCSGYIYNTNSLFRIRREEDSSAARPSCRKFVMQPTPSVDPRKCLLASSDGCFSYAGVELQTMIRFHPRSLLSFPLSHRSSSSFTLIYILKFKCCP